MHLAPTRTAPVVALTVAALLSLAACDRKESGRQDSSGKAPSGSGADSKSAAGKDSMFFPSGQKEGSSIRVDKDVPAELLVGQPFTETITVANISPKDLEHVVMGEQLSASFTPASESEKDIRNHIAFWDIGTLKAGESRIYKLTGTVKEPGEIRHCLRVDFQPQLCTVRKIAVAALQLSMQGPKDALICEPIEYRVSVRNTGTARLEGVKVEGGLPEGLAVEGAKQPGVALDAGALAPGETKELKLRVKPAHRGEYTLKTVAKAMGITADASTRTQVREPALDVTATATESAYVGAPAKAEFTVTNKGDGPSPDTMVQMSVPQGAKVSEAGQQGSVAEKSVSWKLGSLGPGESKKLAVTYTGTAQGTVELQARASGPCVKETQAAAKTSFQGVPAVLLEVVDDPDPVAIGNTVTYTISVLNQGNTSLTNVRVSCALEDSMSYATSEGPTAARATEREVAFEPFGRLDPHGKAVWKAVIKANKAADARFKVRMTSDQVGRPVEETESTHFVPQLR